MRSGQANRLTVESSLKTTLITPLVYIFYSREIHLLFQVCVCVCEVGGRQRAVERAHIHGACMLILKF
jgi:hypothetical protein